MGHGPMTTTPTIMMSWMFSGQATGDALWVRDGAATNRTINGSLSLPVRFPLDPQRSRTDTAPRSDVSARIRSDPSAAERGSKAAMRCDAMQASLRDTFRGSTAVPVRPYSSTLTTAQYIIGTAGQMCECATSTDVARRRRRRHREQSEWGLELGAGSLELAAEAASGTDSVGSLPSLPSYAVHRHAVLLQCAVES